MKWAAISVGAFRATAALGMALTLPACFTFQTVDPQLAQPGEQVQLVLSHPATQELTPAALMGESLVQGDLIDVSEDSVSVSVWIGEAYQGTPFEPVHQAYSFPRVDLVRLERRSLSKPRTVLTALGIMAGIYVLIDRLDYWENPNPAPGGDPPDPPVDPSVIGYWRSISGSRR